MSTPKSLAVIFCDADARWLKRLLPAGLSHVFVMSHDPRSWSSLVLNPRFGRLEIQHEAYDFIPAVGEASTCVVFEPRAALLSPFCPGLTCVSTVKRLLGVWWPFVLTPAQLKRRLIAEGAKVP